MAQTTPNTNPATMQETTTPTNDPETSTITTDEETQDDTTMRTCVCGFQMSRLRDLMGKRASSMAVVVWHNGVEMFPCVHDMQFARFGHEAKL